MLTKTCWIVAIILMVATVALCQSPTIQVVPLIQPPIQSSDYNPGYGTGSGAIILNILTCTHSPCTCAVATGAIPTSMTLSEVTPVSWPAGGCLISGTPSASGDFSFTLTVTDSQSNSVTSSTISVPVLSSSLPSITVPSCSATSATAATCTWTTNVSASSYICLGGNILPVGNGPGGGLTSAGGCTAEADTGGVTSHSVSVTGLQPSSNGSGNGNYFVWVCSRGISGGVPKDYLLVCVDAGAGSKAFTTQAVPAAGTADFYVLLQGPQNVTNTNCANLSQGCAFYVFINQGGIVGETDIHGHNIVYQVTGIPTNSQVHWPDQQDFGDGSGSVSTTTTTNDTLTFSTFSFGVAGQFQILLNVGGTTPNGTYSMTLTVSAGATPTIHTFPYSITVNTNSTALASPVSQPAIPSLATWKGNLTTIGNNYWLTMGQGAVGASDVCPFFGTGLGFYDGDWVMTETGIYLGTSVPWWAGQQACRSNYQSYTVTGSGTWGEQAIYVFSDGQYYDCVTYGIPTSCAGVHQLAETGPGANMQANGSYFGSANFARESSFMLRSKRLDYDLGGGTTTKAQVQAMVNYVLSNMDQYASGSTTALEEHFMAGLMMMSVIEYYEDANTGNADPRIPPAVQTLADYMWNNWFLPWDGNKGCFPYEERSWLTGSGIGTACGGQNAAVLEDLNNLIAPAYAWLYYRTGIQKYQQEADTLFNSSVLEPTGQGIGFFGKTYSQGYWYTFKFLGWRGAISNLGCFMLPQVGSCPKVQNPVPSAGSPML